MGTVQDLQELRAALSFAHSKFQEAQRHAYNAARGGALTDAALRRLNALCENGRDSAVDALTTLRALSLGATPGPEHVREVVGRTLDELRRSDEAAADTELQELRAQERARFVRETRAPWRCLNCNHVNPAASVSACEQCAQPRSQLAL